MVSEQMEVICNSFSAGREEENAGKEKVNRVFSVSVLPFMPQNLPKDEKKQTYLTLICGFLSGF